MSHPNPHKDPIQAEYFEKNIDFAKYVWNELEIAKDKCSSWWVDKPSFMRYSTLWRNGYIARNVIRKHNVEKRNKSTPT